MDLLFSIVTVVVIPAIVSVLKKIKLPTKFAPIAAVVIAVIIVSVGKAFGGVEWDLKTVVATITQALGIAGVSVLGYDAVSKLKETK